MCGWNWDASPGTRRRSACGDNRARFSFTGACHILIAISALMKHARRLLSACLSATLAWTAAPPYAITNARILAAHGKTIAQGVILLRDGLIQATGENIAIPPDALIYDAKGLAVCAAGS